MRVKKFLLAAIFAIAPHFASAGILADLGSMVMANSTAPGTMSTKDRVGVFMGAFTMRSPIKSVNLVTFDPPRIDAGCGGIDLYGGSFSFINSQQLIQIFRQVAADAAGLAFKAAIKSISPSLDALITEFQTLLQNLNNLAKNSCQMAHMIVDPIDKALSNAVNGDGNTGGTNSNMFTDVMGGLKNYLSDANSYFKNQSSNNPKAGNALVKKVVASGASSIMGMAGLPNVDGSSDNPSDPNSLNNMVLYAFLGYNIDAAPCNSLNQSGQGVQSAKPANNTIGQVTCSGPAVMTLDDLVKGGGNGSPRPDIPLNLYKCVNPSGSVFGGVDNQICTQMQVVPFNYVGIQGWVNSMMFGTVDPALSISGNSIVGQVNSVNSTTFSAQQVSFMQQAGVPLAALLSKTSNTSTRVAIAQRLSPHIVDCVAARIGEVLYKGANLIQTTPGYDLTDDQKDRIKTLRTDYLAKQSACNNSDALLRIVTEINEGTRFVNTNIK
ncbi:conjugal transfer protein TraH [Burkholderia cenocepacia]|uniref:conjugal transfer protein TraH n=1 Tax=Burkholderia cenocepacia TaxID=95486 RepID=UPI00196A4EDC|nr:conjugal transfer protein TraH [Burkholderia cenocepacia]MBN3506369.1 conjugal transfer protein TraH [Burkholderia cenocepacia]MBR8030301.1 conjugal transfer protein TraH [Burkholderia cenocepacia]MBR8173408.1 conjugal transfer protein TraH [Burkholderia cenocepacia]